MADVKNFSPIRMTAASEDAAVEQALQIVGVSRDDVSVEVVSKDAKGVTVRVSPRRADEPAGAVAGPPASSVAAGAEAESAAPTAMDKEDEAEEYEIAEPQDTFDDEDIEDEDIEDDGGEEDEDEELEPVEIESAPVAHMPVAPPRPVDPELQELAIARAEEFLERMGMNAQVSVAPPENGGDPDGTPRLFLDIDGEDVGILIGKHGQTLQSFQYLLNITLNNKPAGEGEQADGPRENAIRVLVDAGGYRSRRAGSLQQVARDAASRARRDRRPVRMEPMPAHERRLVHMALQGDEGIATSSEGRDPMRYVVITPAGYRAPEGGERGGGFSRGFGGNRGGRSGGQGGRGGNRSGGYSGRGGSS